ncbi:19278_t:CDS:2, partial [Racocetra fulgida]
LDADSFPSFEYYPLPPLFEDNLSVESQHYGSEPSIVTDIHNNENDVNNVIDTHNEEEECEDDDIEYESTELDVLKLTTDMEFETWDIAKSYFENYAKQEGFSFRKRRCYNDPADNTIARLKERLDQCSRLVDVVEEIQAIFDRQSKRAIVNEFKNEIATRGLPNALEEYFSEINRLLKEYLTLQIYQKQSDQMSQSLCYDVSLVDNWSMLFEETDDSYESETSREDNYDQPQALFTSLIGYISSENIREVWK